MRGIWWLLMGLAACAPLADRDSDGLVAANDCDDEDASRFPGADEVIGDGIDQDCDGFETCFTDADADGHHGEATVEDADLTCAAAGMADAAMAGGDCADDAAGQNPGAAEACGPSDVDEDCDGLVDGDDPDVAGCFDWAGTYAGAVDVRYGIDFAFAPSCLGTATAVADASGAVVLSGTCVLEDSFYASEFGPQTITGSGASTGGYLASGALQIGGMNGTWTGDFRPDVMTVSVVGEGMAAGHYVQFEGGFLGNL